MPYLSIFTEALLARSQTQSIILVPKGPKVFTSDFLTAESSKESPLKTCHKVISAHFPARFGFTQVPEKTIGLFHTLLSVDSAASPLKLSF